MSLWPCEVEGSSTVCSQRTNGKNKGRVRESNEFSPTSQSRRAWGTWSFTAIGSTGAPSP
eukprot:1562081-Prymnesium_polylepis.2